MAKKTKYVVLTDQGPKDATASERREVGKAKKELMRDSGYKHERDVGSKSGGFIRSIFSRK